MSGQGKDWPSKRVVLIKPGDVLFIGNVGELTEEVAAEVSAALVKVKNALALAEIFVFEADIDVAAAAPDGTDA